MQRTTVRLPDDLLEQAKAHARKTGRTLTQLLEQAVRSALAHPTAVTGVAERPPAYTVFGADSGVGAAPSVIQSTAADERAATTLLEQVEELQAFLRNLPDRDLRTPDEILGYNADGVPE